MNPSHPIAEHDDHDDPQERSAGVVHALIAATREGPQAPPATDGAFRFGHLRPPAHQTEDTMDIDDHRAIGNQLDLFHQQEEGPGMVFWHPRGYAIYRVIEDYIRRRMRRAGFREIKTPQLLARSLWEASGHWEKFGGEHVFLRGRRARLRPQAHELSGPSAGLQQAHPLVPRSAAALCEFGACHRNEASGALTG